MRYARIGRLDQHFGRRFRKLDITSLSKPSGLSRIFALDAARGVAICAMIAYHFSWDLSWFSFVTWPVANGWSWRVFAGCIAGSFLFLAGISLALAHGDGIRWPSFWRREATIALAAAGVSLATYVTFGSSFVRFGILHAIAASCLIALPFTRLPAPASAVAALLFATAPVWLSNPAFDGALWVWTGLGEPGFGSVDYVPIAPWTAATLAGVSAAKFLIAFNVPARMQQWNPGGPLASILRLFGQRSLLIYLIHQPILFGLVWSADAVGLAPDRTGPAFVENCRISCEAVQGPGSDCAGACACTLDGLRQNGLWDPLTKTPNDAGLRQQMNQTYALCLADPTVFDSNTASN
ncbi:heparan-alpha-glucosaminide N-acetyltransferase [Roseibium hamelinense]|uniref:heparan-alpha-glucosaminide N-acetyltransferase n=1 Tax=Roseibium hamelinense TaxID=150831 RepID=UPI001AD942FC|nr:heparan-alpha-glucosaminide N-acetyltransferase [Roseibium hamelinense]